MKIIYLNVCLALGISLLVISCKKDADLAPTSLPGSSVTNITAALKGSNEVPANTSAATGFVNGTFDNKTKVLSVTVTFSGMNANNMHIHKGGAGVSGPVIFPIAGTAPSTYSSPTTYTSQPFTAGQEDSLMRSLYYVNVHSTTFPGGEIRGQLTK
jgi:CHRD domain